MGSYYTEYGKTYREYRGNPDECKVCGASTPVTSIVIHHKDGDRSNNRIWNLIALCHSCHVKVHQYGDEYDGMIGQLYQKLKYREVKQTVPINGDLKP